MSKFLEFFTSNENNPLWVRVSIGVFIVGMALGLVYSIIERRKK